ncbi:MAG: hypothetical protein QGF74_02600 [Candidatus Nanoarchaeia archaeon]|jgi:hypothetical protein|nr:hypothetical protein [Candidatus Nanoarchaeia archaeon]|tara:strand:+ start:2198 stop:2722 length:525 start_codon:yes stop_codon:yes gene_type:complete
MNFDLKNLLGMTLVKYDKVDIFKFFLIILAPNILRQVLYYVTFLKTNSVGFIVSYETVKIYNTFPFLGVLEELVIGLVFTFFWFKFIRLRFFAYGWISDAVIDYISVIVWVFLGATPLQFLGLSSIARFFTRELLFSYFIFGVLFFRYRLNINKLVIGFTIFGLLSLISILLFI